MTSRASSHAGWYLAAGVVALAGIAIAVALIWRFIASHEAPTRFLAPGAAAIEIVSPGRHILWHEHRTMYEGRSFDHPPRIPHGVQIAVTAPEGVRLKTEPTSMTERWGTVERAGILAFDAPVPGIYAVVARGDAEPFVLAVGADFTLPLLKAIGGAVAAVVIGVGAGLALALFAFLQRVPSSQPPPATAAALDAAGDLRLRQLTVLVYGLQAVSLLFGLTLVAGVIVNYLKRSEVAGTWLESHFDWQIRTFWWTMLWGMLGLASAIIVVGIFILIATAIWFVYRVAKGWTTLNDGKPIATG